MSWHCLLMCASCIPRAVGFLAGRGVVQGIGSSLRWVLGSARDQWPRGYQSRCCSFRVLGCPWNCESRCCSKPLPRCCFDCWGCMGCQSACMPSGLGAHTVQLLRSGMAVAGLSGSFCSLVDAEHQKKSAASPSASFA
jgi:hypothetical protein